MMATQSSVLGFCKSMTGDKCRRAPSRASITRALLVALVFSAGLYILWLPIHYFFEVLKTLSSPRVRFSMPRPKDDAFKYFAGSQDCALSQHDIYHVPWPENPKASPFCDKRAALLDALSGGGRHGFDEPYVGKGCTYRWFSTPEICMILERFPRVVFVGDQIAQSIYTALNILIQEDLALGGLQQRMLSEQERGSCKCDNQITNKDCLKYRIKNSEDTRKNENVDRTGSAHFCERVHHAYISISSTSASAAALQTFRDLTYGKPDPWQPIPIVLSFGHASSLDPITATNALDEWHALGIGAERNMPMLFIGPTAFSMNRASTKPPKGGNAVVWQFTEQMAAVARERHFDVLNLFNLTSQASSIDGETFGQKDALVEAMMVVNWLSKLQTS